MSIKLLSPDAVAQITSSIAITSLNGVVVELVKNSLDAGATKVEVKVDYGRGSCVVEDNGSGILPNEFDPQGGLGKLHYTSKWDQESAIHGFRGTFLAQLSSMALVTISSHHHLHRSHNTLSMHNSLAVARHMPALVQQQLVTFDHGTRVSVHDLFGNMPVRVKMRAASTGRQGGASREWIELRHDIVKVLLPWTAAITLDVRLVDQSERIYIRAPPVSPAHESVDVSRLCSILTQSSHIPLDNKQSWVPVGASTAGLKVVGAISLEAAATKSVQFLAYGVKPISGSSIVHDTINQLFSNSSFGDSKDTDRTNDLSVHQARKSHLASNIIDQTHSKTSRKGIDRWPRFFFAIILTRPPGVAEHGLTTSIRNGLDDSDSSLTAILVLIRAIVQEFLIQHSFIASYHSTCDETRSDSDFQSRTSDAREKFCLRAASAPPRETLRSRVSQKHGLSSFDPLGTNVKLTLLDRAPYFDDVIVNLESRRRMGKAKSGRMQTTYSRTEDSKAWEIQRPLTAPPYIKLAGDLSPSSGSSHLSLSNSAEGLSLHSGAVIRHPLPNAESRKSVSAPLALTRSTSLAHASALIPCETKPKDFVIWVNPTTKVRSLVDTRTGFTVPSQIPYDKIVLPTRPISARGLGVHNSSIAQRPGPWLNYMLNSWNNPVFTPTELKVPQVSLHGDLASQDTYQGKSASCSRHDASRIFVDAAAGFGGHLSKIALSQAQVIGQLEKKFILVKVPVKISEPSDSGPYNHQDDGSVLTIVDQHAADERIRIEGLLEEFFMRLTETKPSQSLVHTKPLHEHLKLAMSPQDLELLEKHKQHFRDWGIFYDISNPPASSNFHAERQQSLKITSLPLSIIERCRQDPQMLQETLRREAWKIHQEGTGPSPKTGSWSQKIQACPQGILEMLNSRACRSAIMFNDNLTLQQCQVLIEGLGKCKFPFQCAHGRPSLVPLLALNTVRCLNHPQMESQHFGSAFRKWNRYRKE